MLWSHETTMELTGSCLIATLKLCDDVSCNSRVCGVPAETPRCAARRMKAERTHVQYGHLVATEKDLVVYALTLHCPSPPR